MAPVPERAEGLRLRISEVGWRKIGTCDIFTAPPRYMAISSRAQPPIYQQIVLYLLQIRAIPGTISLTTPGVPTLVLSEQDEALESKD